MKKKIITSSLFVLFAIGGYLFLNNPPAPKNMHWEILDNSTVDISAGDLIDKNGTRIASYLGNQSLCIPETKFKIYTTNIQAKWSARQCGIRYFNKIN